MGKLKTAVFQMITEPNNKTVCPVRIMSILAFLQFSAMTAWSLIHTGAFDVRETAVSFAALIGGIGAALGLKKDSPSNNGDDK